MTDATQVVVAPQAPAPEEAEASAKSPLDAILDAQANELPSDEEQEQDEAEGQDEAEERKLQALLRKAEKAFCRGNKGLLLSRVECGKWCHEIYVLRQEENH